MFQTLQETSKKKKKNKDINLRSQNDLFVKAKSNSALISCKCKYYPTSFSFFDSCIEIKLNIRM